MSRYATKIQEKLLPMLKEFTVRGNAQVCSPLGCGRGQSISFVLAGSTYEGLAKAHDRILAAA